MRYERMSRKELRQLLLTEVYDNKKMNCANRFLERRLNPSKNAVYLIRLFQYFSHRRSNLFARFLGNRLVTRYGIFVSGSNKIGKGLSLPHPQGIVIGKSVEIGENCTIFQQVTVGGARIRDSLKANQPRLGNECCLFAGCKVLGNISLADGTCVGANSVLLQSTEPNGVYAGSPARKVR